MIVPGSDKNDRVYEKWPYAVHRAGGSPSIFLVIFNRDVLKLFPRIPKVVISVSQVLKFQLFHIYFQSLKVGSKQFPISAKVFAQFVVPKFYSKYFPDIVILVPKGFVLPSLLISLSKTMITTKWKRVLAQLQTAIAWIL